MAGDDLGTFLRARREAVRPRDVGLPDNGRRRTPGLRRSEVAMLAGISVEYLTRLEQGHDRHPTTQVIAAVADALRLGAYDRRHLHELVAISHGSDLRCSVGCPTQNAVPGALLALLDRLEPTPAVIVGRRTELWAWTTAFDRLVRPLGILDQEAPESMPELIRYAFTDDRARSAVADWDRLADALVTWLYADATPATTSTVKELSREAGREFTERWRRRPTGRLELGLAMIMNPTVGAVRLISQTLQAEDGFALVAQLPADDAAQAALDELCGLRMLRTVDEKTA